MKTLFEAIDLRRSRRTFLDTPLSVVHLQHLKNLMLAYNQESGLHMKLIEDATSAFKGFRKSYGMLKGVRTVLALVGNTSDKHLEEKCGYYGELLVLEATKLGLGSCWVGGTYDKKSNVFQVGENQTLCCVIPIGNVAEETRRERIIHSLAARKSKTVEEMLQTDVPAPTWLQAGMEAVRKAPSAVNHQPAHFKYKNNKLTATVKNKYAFENIDLGIAKAHFVLAAGGHFDFGNGASYVRKD